MDNELDQAIGDLVVNDTNKPVAKSVDDSLDAALVDMAAIIPDF